eukprot:g8571.t1
MDNAIDSIADYRPGKGGSAEVFAVYDSKNNRFAVKIVKAKTSSRWVGVLEEVKLMEHLQNESRSCSRHVVRMYRSLEDPESLQLYLLLEYADCDIAEYIRRRNAAEGMAFLEVFECWSQMVCAVGHIHRHKIVHSDVKPANFLLVRGRVKLSDFGLARQILDDHSHVSRHQQCGTIRFMAPEQIFQPENVCHAFRNLKNARKSKSSSNAMFHLKPSADVWSLGVILYQLLYLETPFQQLEKQLGSGVRTMFAISDPRVQVLYPSLDSVVRRGGRRLALAEEEQLDRLASYFFGRGTPATAAAGSAANLDCDSAVENTADTGGGDHRVADEEEEEWPQFPGGAGQVLEELQNPANKNNLAFDVLQPDPEPQGEDFLRFKNMPPSKELDSLFPENFEMLMGVDEPLQTELAKGQDENLASTTQTKKVKQSRRPMCRAPSILMRRGCLEGVGKSAGSNESVGVAEILLSFFRSHLIIKADLLEELSEKCDEFGSLWTHEYNSIQQFFNPGLETEIDRLELLAYLRVVFLIGRDGGWPLGVGDRTDENREDSGGETANDSSSAEEDEARRSSLLPCFSYSVPLKMAGSESTHFRKWCTRLLVSGQATRSGGDTTQSCRVELRDVLEVLARLVETLTRVQPRGREVDFRSGPDCVNAHGGVFDKSNVVVQLLDPVYLEKQFAERQSAWRYLRDGLPCADAARVNGSANGHSLSAGASVNFATDWGWDDASLHLVAEPKSRSQLNGRRQQEVDVLQQNDESHGEGEKDPDVTEVLLQVKQPDFGIGIAARGIWVGKDNIDNLWSRLWPPSSYADEAGVHPDETADRAQMHHEFRFAPAGVVCQGPAPPHLKGRDLGYPLGIKKWRFVGPDFAVDEDDELARPHASARFQAGNDVHPVEYDTAIDPDEPTVIDDIVMKNATSSSRPRETRVEDGQDRPNPSPELKSFATEVHSGSELSYPGVEQLLREYVYGSKWLDLVVDEFASSVELARQIKVKGFARTSTRTQGAEARISDRTAFTSGSEMILTGVKSWDRASLEKPLGALPFELHAPVLLGESDHVLGPNPPISLIRKIGVRAGTNLTPMRVHELRTRFSRALWAPAAAAFALGQDEKLHATANEVDQAAAAPRLSPGALALRKLDRYGLFHEGDLFSQARLRHDEGGGVSATATVPTETGDGGGNQVSKEEQERPLDLLDIKDQDTLFEQLAADDKDILDDKNPEVTVVSDHVEGRRQGLVHLRILKSYPEAIRLKLLRDVFRTPEHVTHQHDLARVQQPSERGQCPKERASDAANFLEDVVMDNSEETLLPETRLFHVLDWFAKATAIDGVQDVATEEKYFLENFLPKLKVRIQDPSQQIIARHNQSGLVVTEALRLRDAARAKLDPRGTGHCSEAAEGIKKDHSARSFVVPLSYEVQDKESSAKKCVTTNERRATRRDEKSTVEPLSCRREVRHALLEVECGPMELHGRKCGCAVRIYNAAGTVMPEQEIETDHEKQQILPSAAGAASGLGGVAATGRATGGRMASSDAAAVLRHPNVHLALLGGRTTGESGRADARVKGNKSLKPHTMHSVGGVLVLPMLTWGGGGCGGDLSRLVVDCGLFLRHVHRRRPQHVNPPGILSLDAVLGDELWREIRETRASLASKDDDGESVLRLYARLHAKFGQPEEIRLMQSIFRDEQLNRHTLEKWRSQMALTREHKTGALAGDHNTQVPTGAEASWSAEDLEAAFDRDTAHIVGRYRTFAASTSAASPTVPDESSRAAASGSGFLAKSNADRNNARAAPTSSEGRDSAGSSVAQQQSWGERRAKRLLESMRTRLRRDHAFRLQPQGIAEGESRAAPEFHEIMDFILDALPWTAPSPARYSGVHSSLAFARHFFGFGSHQYKSWSLDIHNHAVSCLASGLREERTDFEIAVINAEKGHADAESTNTRHFPTDVARVKTETELAASQNRAEALGRYLTEHYILLEEAAQKLARMLRRGVFFSKNPRPADLLPGLRRHADDGRGGTCEAMAEQEQPHLTKLNFFATRSTKVKHCTAATTLRVTPDEVSAGDASALPMPLRAKKAVLAQGAGVEEKVARTTGFVIDEESSTRSEKSEKVDSRLSVVNSLKRTLSAVSWVAEAKSGVAQIAEKLTRPALGQKQNLARAFTGIAATTSGATEQADDRVRVHDFLEKLKAASSSQNMHYKEGLRFASVDASTMLRQRPRLSVLAELTAALRGVGTSPDGWGFTVLHTLTDFLFETPPTERDFLSKKGNLGMLPYFPDTGKWKDLVEEFREGAGDVPAKADLTDERTEFKLYFGVVKHGCESMTVLAEEENSSTSNGTPCESLQELRLDRAPTGDWTVRRLKSEIQSAIRGESSSSLGQEHRRALGSVASTFKLRLIDGSPPAAEFNDGATASTAVEMKDNWLLGSLRKPERSSGRAGGAEP